MRLLNETFSPTPKVRIGKLMPLHRFNLRGKHFMLDSRSLAILAEDCSAASIDSCPTTSFMRTPFIPVEHRKPGKPRFLILNVTERCNLRCSYCFREPEGEFGPARDGTRKVSSFCSLASERPGRCIGRDMDESVLLAALRLVSGMKRPDIGFFGGEPLLNFPIIERAVKRVPGASFHLTTNGTLINGKIARFLKKRNFSIIVSLDGPAHIHNPCRSHSFLDVFRGLVALSRAGLKRITLRATYTPDCIHLVERLEFFREMLRVNLAGTFSIEPAALRPGETWDKSSLQREHKEQSEWLLRFPKMLDVYFGYRVVSERIKQGKPHVYNCGAGNRYITVAADGTIHACHRESSPIGHVKSGFDERRDAWIEPEEPKECRKCWARYICGGGCHAARQYERSTEQCVPMKIFIKETIYLIDELCNRRGRS